MVISRAEAEDLSQQPRLPAAQILAEQIDSTIRTLAYKGAPFRFDIPIDDIEQDEVNNIVWAYSLADWKVRVRHARRDDRRMRIYLSFS